MLGFVLDVEELPLIPSAHRLLHVPLHVPCDLRLELLGLEEGGDKAVDSPLQAAVDHEDGGLPHQLRQGLGVPRHEGLRAALEDESAHLGVGGHDRRAAEDVRLEHFPVPNQLILQLNELKAFNWDKLVFIGTHARRRLFMKLSGRGE